MNEEWGIFSDEGLLEGGFYSPEAAISVAQDRYDYAAGCGPPRAGGRDVRGLQRGERGMTQEQKSEMVRIAHAVLGEAQS